MGSAQITYDPLEVSHDAIKHALDEEGYPVLDFTPVN